LTVNKWFDSIGWHYVYMSDFTPQTEGQFSFSLTDYINSLFKRRIFFGSVIFIFFLSGVVHYVIRPELPFPHVTTIEIGIESDNILLEDLSTVKTKLEEAFIPSVLQEHSIQEKYDVVRYKINVKIPDVGKTIVLQTDAPMEITETILALHTKVANLLLNSHQQLIEIKRRELDQEKFKAELVLEELKEQEATIPQRQKFVNEKEKLLKKQIAELQKIITDTEVDRSIALNSGKEKGSFDQSLSTTLLLLDKTISDYRDRLRSFEEKLNLDITKEYYVFLQENAELKRAQREQEQVIYSIDFQKQNLKATRLLLSPSRLLRPPQLGPKQDIALFTGLGIVLALFLVPLVDFISTTRNNARETTQFVTQKKDA